MMEENKEKEIKDIIKDIVIVSIATFLTYLIFYIFGLWFYNAGGRMKYVSHNPYDYIYKK